MTQTFTLTFSHPAIDTYTVDTADLPANSIAFLLEYGFRQYLADGAAVNAKDDEGNPRSVLDIEREKRAGIEKRIANVEQGVFPRGGGARDPLAVETRRVAKEAFKAAVKASGKKLPDDKEARREMFDAYRAKHAERFTAIAQRNLDAAAELSAPEL